MRLTIVALAALGFFVAAPAGAADLAYTTTLDGAHDPSATGSRATGTASVSIDTAARTIDARLVVTGLSFSDLSAHLAHSRMGPIHLHRYAPDGDVTLIMPFPFGASYAATADGFTVTVNDYPYADGAAALRSDMSFEAFVAALGTDPIYLNIHTNAFPDGEISGRLTPRA